LEGTREFLGRRDVDGFALLVGTYTGVRLNVDENIDARWNRHVAEE
jgi:hypothetical protein